MINIDNICCGWARLTIGENKFMVSYLSYLKDDIDELLDFENINEDYNSHRITLEGESNGDLALVSYLTYGTNGYNINIVWHRLYSKENEPVIMTFPYLEFLEEWKRIKEDIRERYIKEFICVQTLEEYEEEDKNY